MTDSNRHFVLPDWLQGIGMDGVPDLSDRDAACLVLPSLDYSSQLIAIHETLGRHKEADAELQRHIAEAEAHAKEASGICNEWAVDEWIDRLHASAYQDAAHSMAAVGMLAPFVESLFYQAFQGIRWQFEEETQEKKREEKEKEGKDQSSNAMNHDRWLQASVGAWDCHFTWSHKGRGGGLTDGILQLLDAVGLHQYMPSDLKSVLQALFEYRNKMFHCGFEWPLDEREQFQTRIQTANWPSEWFAMATRDDKPWIYYITDTFIGHCLETVDQVLEGVGRFCNVRFFGSHPDPKVAK